MKSVGVMIVAMLILCGTVYAERTIWYVHPDSSLNTIQAGLDSCVDSDIVLVGPGTYYENIVWPNTQGIHLISELGPEVTLIDGGSIGNVIVCSTGLDSTTMIRGLTVRNGYGDPFGGGGILCANNSSPTIAGNTITDNYGQCEGGGIRCIDNSSPTITGNTITDNGAYWGGGIHCSNASPTIINNIITDNSANGYSNGSGGGIYCEGSSSMIADNTIIRNHTSGHGLSGCSGGGIQCQNSSPTIINNLVVDNTAGNQSGAGAGAGISCFYSSPILKHNTIMNNTTIGFAPVAQPGGIFLRACSGSLDSCTIVANGGDCGVKLDQISTFTINYCNICGNSGYGIINSYPSSINAEHNWWGDATGPYHATLNPGGLGDSVSDYVDFTPWLTDSVQGVAIEEEPIIKPVEEYENLTATIFHGPLRLPEGKKCKVFDITGRVVEPTMIKPGIYFIEIDDVVTQKVVKVR
jgi:hypothetical protein